MDDITLALRFLDNWPIPELALHAGVDRDEVERRLKRMGCEWSAVEERLRERGDLELAPKLPGGRTGEMYRYYQDGHNIEEVGARFKLSKQRVSQIFQKAGLKTRVPYVVEPRRKIDPAQIRAKYWGEGLSVLAVATYFKTAPDTITRIMDEHAIPRRKPGRAKKEKEGAL